MMIRACSEETTGLLISGGVDSAILLAQLLEGGTRVQPLYVRTGCAWESAERRAIDRLVETLADEALEPVVDLDMPVADLYGDHWSVTGRNVPDETTPDEAVFLWGRNPLLLLKAVLWCQLNRVPRLALGTLASNPFADASPRFFQQFEQALQIATGKKIEIFRPFESHTKTQVLALGAGLPLHLTFSCLAPQGDQHCGACNKCEERRQALQTLPGGDPTVYARRALTQPSAVTC